MTPTVPHARKSVGVSSPGSFRRWWNTVGLNAQIDVFLENLAALLNAGIDITSALNAIIEETPSRRMRRVISDLRQEIVQGSSFTTALEKIGLLPSRILTLIRFGELSGKLIENLKVVVLQNAKENQFRSRVRSSLSYSVVVVVLTILIGTATAVFTLPKLADFYAGSGVELPLLTRLMIDLGHFISQYAAFILPPIAAVFLIVVYFLFSFPRTRFIGHSLLFRTPLIRGLIVNVEVSRFCYILGTTLEAGVPLVEALEAAISSTTFANYKHFYQYLRKHITEGYSFRRCFQEYRQAKLLFPASVRQLLMAAEQSGMLSESLLKIGAMYEQKTDTLARNIPVIIEPILLIIIGLGVMFLALATILPIYNLSNVIN